MKYIKLFETTQQYDSYIGGASAILPNVSVCKDTSAVHYMPKPSIPSIPNDEIWYTSTNGKIVTPYSTNVFGANIVSNTYVDGKGIIKFNGDVTSIGTYAFAWCETLAEITIPNSVTSIGTYAFYFCEFGAITIPSSVTSIGGNAFCSVFSLTDFNYSGTVLQWNNVALSSNWKSYSYFTVVHCSDGDSTRLS